MKKNSDPDIHSEYTSGVYQNDPKELHLACNSYSPGMNTHTGASNKFTANTGSSLTCSTTPDYENLGSSVTVEKEFMTNEVSSLTCMEPWMDPMNYSSDMPITNAYSGTRNANTMPFFSSMKSWTNSSHPANYSSALQTNAYSSNTYDGLTNINVDPYVSYFRHNTKYHNSQLFRNISEYSSNRTLYEAGAHQPFQEENQQLLHGPQMSHRFNDHLPNILIDRQVLPQPSTTVFAGPALTTSDHDTSYQRSFDDVIPPSSYSGQNAPNWERIKYDINQSTFSSGSQLKQDNSQSHSYVSQEEFSPQSSLQVPINYKSESIQINKYEDGVFHLQESICTEEIQFHSDECSADFPTQTIMKKHVQRHNGEELFRGDMCTKTFSDPGNLKKHKQIHTGEKPYECDLCPMKFLYACYLKSHRRTHTGERPYQCNLCPKKFSQSEPLKKHARTHTGEKPYQCDLCLQKFLRSDYLQSHRRTHTGEKPYQCNLCPRKFSQSNHLKKHRRTHTGEKPYQCDLCPNKFTQSHHLKNHRRTHNGEKTYQ